MESKKSTPWHIANSIVLTLTGIGIGGLAGISVSPTATVLLSSLLAAVGIASAFNFEKFFDRVLKIFEKLVDRYPKKTRFFEAINREKTNHDKSDQEQRKPATATSTEAFDKKAFSSMLLVLGVCVGSVAGILTRTGNVLENYSTAKSRDALYEEIEWWTNLQITGDPEKSSPPNSKEQIDKNELKIQIAQILLNRGYSTNEGLQAFNISQRSPTESEENIATASEPISSSEIGGLIASIEANDCSALREATRSSDPAKRLGTIAESLRDTDQAIADEFPSPYFDDSVVLAGALLTLCF